MNIPSKPNSIEVEIHGNFVDGREIEAGNGEFDDCLEMAARATDEIKERRHTLQPGEKLKVLQSNE